MNRKPVLLIVAAMIFCVFSPARAESASVLLEKGVFAEQTRGDLDAAVKIYKRILADAEANRKHVARAQFRLGMCYRKQKRPAEAVAAFEKVVGGFPKQGKLVADARKQIAQIKGAISGPALAKMVEDAVRTISTCTEADPRVGQTLASLKGLNEKAVVAELVTFLAAEKNTVRRSAIYILWKGGFDDISAAEAPLKKLCKHEEAMTRGMAALTLGGAKVGSSFDLLCGMTANDASGYARRCAAYALGLMGRADAKGVLEKALKDTEPMVRNNAEAALALLGLSTGPRIVKTTPATYANDVAPSLTELTATFDRTMLDKHWAWVKRSADKFPELVGKPHFDAKRRTCSITVKLQPGKVYWVELNTPPHTYFRTPAGAIARPYALVFATKSADGKPTPIPADLLARARQINAASAGADDVARGWLLMGARKLKEAEAVFRKLVETEPDNAEAHNGLGWAVQNQGKIAEGKASFEKCLAINPRHPAALNGLAWIAKAAGKTDEAIAYWERAVAAAPGATAALCGLARTHMERKEYDQAAKYYQAWLKFEPANREAREGLKKAKAAGGARPK